MKKLLISTMLLLMLNTPLDKPIEDDGLKDIPPVELVSAKSAVLMEVETGSILYEYNANEKRAPASMTKIMTMKLVLDAINGNTLSMDELLTTSSYASSMGGSQIFLAPNEQMKVADLFKSMVIASANDAAVVFAERISGTETNFAKLMNQTAVKLGCKNTNFVNATGLPIDNHYTTCYDLGLIACDLLRNYEEEVIPYSSMYESYIREDSDNPFWLVNTNKLIKQNIGIDGLKTGWTNEAGYCITTTMKKDGMRLVSVVMGAESPEKRNIDALNILNYGFNNYVVDVIYEKGTIIEINSDILISPSTYHVVTSNNIVYLHHKANKLGEITYEIDIDRKKIRNLAKDQIGRIKIYNDGKLISTSDLELVESLEKASFIELLLTIFKSLF